ncbi:MAG: beta/gamma crystallin-related protein [Clostridium sp.]|uniref:beta/gamma crystallin-related protein n=1 Tax=Clostridium sp. TaxID=1506 RepID=UPI0028FF86B0|nr:beta/gamma crystallin-related protein [Clostridium sp.]MDU2895703.1 beta/gamma crystallin-related protein [Clostridium sp.]MDU3008095.1 beta/gamma crystallin-related protein [Clostridium sp.]MDU3037956.1 beta/gamma crystallin-related protein [Clostridium sp.]MDU3052928.1 beta/gamma crystallin-related protein [Clostridium sp.]
MADAIQGHIILFKHANFHGDHKHIFNMENNLNADDDNDFNDEVSSIAVIQGTWEVFYNSEYGDIAKSGTKSISLPPGLYKNVEEVGIINDKISSLRLI